MRPLRLELSGFAAFRERAEVDLTGADLIALVGPTGSGKSTLIDAVTFALYGSVPRYGHVGLVAPAINQLANEARVRLDFELAGTAYSAVRVVRRTKTGANTREARLQCGEVVLAGSVGDMGPAVESLLGLTFDQFCRTVVLPQGEFAQFLHDDPARRQDLLVRLLDLGVYEAMAARARRRAARTGERVAVLDEQLAASAEVTVAGLASLRRTLTELDGLAGAVESAGAVIRSLDAQLAAAEAAASRFGEQVAALERIVVPIDSTDLDAQLAAARVGLERAEIAVGEQRRRRDMAQERVAACPDPGELRSILDAHRRHRILIDDQAGLVSAHRRCIDDLELAREAAAAAQRAFETAENTLRLARVTADAASWAGLLVVGTPCPVCRQEVHELPAHDARSELSQAERAEGAARAELRASTESRLGAERAEALAHARVTAAEAERAGVAELVRGAAPEPDLVRRLDEVSAAHDELRSAQADLTTAESEREQRRRVTDGLVRREAELTRAFTSARDAVVARELQPPAPDGASLLADWQALAAWAAGALAETTAAADDLRSQCRAVIEQRSAKLSELTAQARAAGVDANIDRLSSVVAARLAEAQAAVAAYAARLEAVGELREARAVAAADQTVSDEMGRLLGARGFERWLLAEALTDLAARATERLSELSGGQYSLVVDHDQFKICDHRNADELRDTRTLSGGETFLASLALALALADGVADLAGVGSPPLESVFLDEGFGTLDPETLDVVASALEELGATGRMVAVVTHIRELADRLPVRLEVRRGPVTSTVSRVEQ